MGKGEIARNKRFLLFPQCFQKACFPGASKGVIEWEWVKHRMVWYKQISFNIEEENKSNLKSDKRKSRILEEK